DLSETPSAVFRNVSFTMRQRFTLANACSTRTRMRPTFRLVRFSAAVSAPPAAFFFPLAGLRYRGLVSLETAILVQDRSRRIGDILVLGDALVRGPSDVGVAQEADTLTAGLQHHHVLVAVDLLPAAVVRCLFFRVFRPLATPLGPVNDQTGRWPGGRLGAREGVRVALRQRPQVVEGLAQDGQQATQPIVHLRLAQ